MAISHGQVNVRIDEGILWIGDNAYPLRNIARVSSKTWTPDKGKIVRSWLGRLIAAGIAALIGFSVNVVAGLLLTLLFAYLIYKLVDALNIPTLYELVVETSGSPQHALMTTDQALVQRLVAEVTKGIGNPTYSLPPMVVNNYNLGDNVNMFGGAGNVGISRSRA